MGIIEAQIDGFMLPQPYQLVNITHSLHTTNWCCSINMQSGRFAESPTWISFVLANGRVLGVSEIWGAWKRSLFQILLGALRAPIRNRKVRNSAASCGLRRIAMCSKDFRLRQNPKNSCCSHLMACSLLAVLRLRHKNLLCPSSFTVASTLLMVTQLINFLAV